MTIKDTNLKTVNSSDRYLTEISWLKSFHSFSFGEHYHPENTGWGSLRVINEDFIAPGGKFNTHPHRDMEIITYLVKGNLQHKDSAGNEYVIKAGDVQRISAGSGILHSEENISATEEVHMLQIWITPEVKQTEPEYTQNSFKPEDLQNQLKLIVSKTGAQDSIAIKQDTNIYAAMLDKDLNLDFNTTKDRSWLQLISGTLNVNGQQLKTGDALAFMNKSQLSIKALTDSHFLVFDIAS
jgi:redox-sensitive bicupin YhaK (pirin superfamily)